MASVGYMLYQIQILIKKYFDYPVTTQISLQYDTTVAFPMITFCNLNPVRRSKIMNLGSAFQTVLQYEGGSWTDDLNDTTMAQMEAAITTTNWTQAQTASSDYFDTRSDTYYQSERIKQMLANMDKDEREDVGHDLDQMLMSCEYNGRHCSPVNFTSFFNSHYGNCYVFNSGTATPVTSVTKPGPGNGLILDLFIEHDEYISEASEAAGIKVVVTNQTDMPFPEDEGYLVSPGMLTNIAITRMAYAVEAATCLGLVTEGFVTKDHIEGWIDEWTNKVSYKTDINRASAPYGTCMDYDGTSLAERNLFLSSYSHLDVTYTDQACYKTCYQKAIISTCGCCSADYPCEGEAVVFPLSMVNQTDTKICDIDDQEQDDCQKKLDAEMEAGISSIKCDEECLTPCSEIMYSSEISSTLWPCDPKVYGVSLDLMKANTRLAKQLSKKGASDLVAIIRNNVLKLKVFYQKLNYQVINTTSSYSESDLISDVGGQLGIWAGISIIAIFEFGEYFVNICILVALKMCGRKTVNEKLVSPQKDVFENIPRSQVLPMESLNMERKNNEEY